MDNVFNVYDKKNRQNKKCIKQELTYFKRNICLIIDLFLI